MQNANDDNKYIQYYISNTYVFISQIKSQPVIFLVSVHFFIH